MIGNNKTFISVSRPIYVCSKFGGLHLLQYQKNGQIISTIKYDIGGVILFLILLLTNIYSFYWNYKSTSLTDLSNSFIIEKLIHLFLFVGLISDIHTLIWHFMKANENFKILKNFTHFDGEVINLGAVTLTYNTRQLVVIFLFAPFIYELLLTMISLYIWNSEWMLFIFYFGLFVFATSYTMSFICYNYLLMNLYKRFQLINVYLW